MIVDYGGKDITEIMEDPISHVHTEVAYEMLDEMLVGFVADGKVMEIVTNSEKPDNIVPLQNMNEQGKRELEANGVDAGEVQKVVYENTGMSCAEDLNKDTDATTDYSKHKFLDLNRPLLMQVFNGGFSKKFYLEQVHRPRHYKGGASAPLFGNFLEPLSLTPWWVVPMVWLPPVAYGTYLAGCGLGSPTILAAYWALGLFLWTLDEYGLHRCLFHICLLYTSPSPRD